MVAAVSAIVKGRHNPSVQVYDIRAAARWSAERDGTATGHTRLENMDWKPDSEGHTVSDSTDTKRPPPVQGGFNNSRREVAERQLAGA